MGVFSRLKVVLFSVNFVKFLTFFPLCFDFGFAQLRNDTIRAQAGLTG